MRLVAIALAAVLALAACHGDPPAPCRCTPGNVARTKHVGEDHPINGAGLLALVRRHRALVEQRAPNRDVKLVDDEIRIDVAAFCQPCGDWVGDRMTVDEMFPLARLDDATAAVCLGFVLRDGSTAFGPGHPAACGP